MSLHLLILSSREQLWAIMLRNCSGVFIQQCASRKFLDTLEDVLQASKTSPVVRERLLEVLAGAAYMSPSGELSLFDRVSAPALRYCPSQAVATIRRASGDCGERLKRLSSLTRCVRRLQGRL